MIKLVAILILLSNIVFAITVEEIMDRVDEYRHLQSAHIKSKMIIQQGRREIVKEMESRVKGENYGLTEFTNPRDRGTKFLKREDELYMFFPDAEDIVRISGHMLEQGVMGSDFSYRDMLESAKLTDLYDFSILRKEEYDGINCYVIEGVKKPTTDASYYRRVSWVDSERFVLIKEELYAQSGRLLKVMSSQKVEEIDGRYFTTHLVIDNQLRQNTKTEYIIQSIEFDVDIPDSVFSIRSLRGR